jgi:hypothetical protein
VGLLWERQPVERQAEPSIPSRVLARPLMRAPPGASPSADFGNGLSHDFNGRSDGIPFIQALPYLDPIAGEPALLQLRWEATDGGADEGESAEMAFENLSDAEAATLALRRVVRLGWTMHCRAMLLEAWERHAAAKQPLQLQQQQQPTSRAAATAAEEAVQTWACQLLSAERSRPPMEVFSVVLALFATIPNPSAARVHQASHSTHYGHSWPPHLTTDKARFTTNPVCARSGSAGRGRQLPLTL